MRKFLAILLCGSLAFTGVNCATTGDSQVLVAEIILDQLEATLDSVEAALELYKGEPVDSEAYQILRITLAIAKPQILSWMNTIKLINQANGQYDRADSLIKRYEGMEADINYVVPDVVL